MTTGLFRLGVAMLAALAASCGSATVETGGGTVQAVPVASTYSGQYNGPGRFDVIVSQPVQRVIPTRSFPGSAVIQDGGGATYTVDVRVVESNCRFNVSRTTAGGMIPGGQVCVARIVYDGTPADLAIQVTDGQVAYNAGALVLTFRGPFTSEVHTSTGTLNVQGNATYRLDARR